MRTLFASVACLLVAAPVFAAEPPVDAGRLFNEQRQPGNVLPDRLPKSEASPAERAHQADTGARVLIKEIRFSGLSGIVSQGELQEIAADSIGKELSIADLQALADRTTAYLRDKKGFLLARAYLPRQDVTAGVIEIAIVAGRVEGQPKVNFKGSHRLKQSVIDGIAERALPEGTPAMLDQIERVVLVSSDLPGIQAQAGLEPGSSQGTTRILLDVAEGPLFSGSAGIDNYGSRYTGAIRGTVNLALNDPSGYGDQFSVSLTGAENNFQGRVGYSIPMGITDAVASVSYTGLYYEIGKEFASSKSRGTADTFNTVVSYPIMRSRAQSLWVSMGGEYMLTDDKSLGVSTRKKELPVGNISLNGSFYDAWGGGGITSTGVNLYVGSLDLSGVQDAKDNDELTAKTGGGFSRVAYSLARLQMLTKQTSLYAAVRGQFAGDNLDSSQKFVLGGPSGVRAYAVGEGSGDEGHAITLEVRYDLVSMPSWATTQLIGFVDTGWVKLHKQPWLNSVNTATGKNDYMLSGLGVGFNVAKTGTYSLRASYAHTLDGNPGRSTTGKDTDGKSNDNRFWFQATVNF